MLQPPACVVLPPVLVVSADTTGCLTGTAELGVDVAGPSLPACPLVATMILRFRSISPNPSNSGTVGVSPHWRWGCLAPGSLLLTGMRPEYPGRAPKVRFLWRPVCWCVVRVVRQSRRASLSHIGGLSLARHPVSNGTSLSAVCYTLDFPQSSQSLFSRYTPRLPLLLSLLQRQFRSTAGSAILYLLLSSRHRGSTLTQSRPSVVYLTDPSIAGTGASDGSSLVCLHCNPHWEQQSFSFGVDSFIGNDRFTPSPLTRSPHNFLYLSRYSRPHLLCLLSAGAAHLTLVV